MDTYKETGKSYRKHIASVCSDSPKKFWSFIKSLKIDSMGIPTLKRNGRLESDNRCKAEILNDQFKSVFTTENDNPPQEAEPTIPSMPDITINLEDVTKLLKNLNPNKASGPDGISPRILQLAADELAPALCVIFQKSLDTGEIPKTWLQANISPIFKKGDRTLASNYRPVSLTAVCSKVLEHIVHSNIMKNFDRYSILTDKQHGFRSKHSTESQLILTTHDLAHSLNSKSQVDMIIMDFSKAFDVVPHNRLLNKLNRYGIHSRTHAWITSFLKHRVQRVVVGGEHSTWTDVVSGVPQGTVLGPLLFLAYINDLPQNISSSVRLFADDCVLYRQIENQIDSEALQQDLNTLTKWEKDWQMHFNPQKCFVMRLTHKRNPVYFDYKLGESILQETDNHSYLGVTITNNLTWNNHINQISASANRSLGFIRRNLYSCSKQTKESAYKTLVRPLVEYSSSVWDPYTKSLTNQVEKIQRRAARFVTGDYQSRAEGCMTDMLEDLGWDSLESRRKARRIIIFHKGITGHLSLPVGNLLQPAPRPSRHNNSKSFATLAASKDCYKNSFFVRTIKDWNSLPENIVTIIPDPLQFKQALNKSMNTQQD